jgi:ABC-type sugar transport system ATPase subunit
MNFVPCELRADAGAVVAAAPGLTVRLAPDAVPATGEPRAAILGIRPHDVEVVAAADADLVARADVVEPLGAAVLVHVEREGVADFRIVVDADAPPALGAVLGLRLRRDRIHLFAADGDRPRLAGTP